MGNLRIFLAVLFNYFAFTYSSFDASKFLVWGPGLNVKIVLPVRYFYVQAVDDNGNNITKSLGEKALDLHITHETLPQLRIHAQVLDRHDGSYLVQFRPYQTYQDLTIILRYMGELVGNSPYYLKGPVYDEDCDCPTKDLDEFIKAYGCPRYAQIEDDFRVFPTIDMKEVWGDMRVRFDRPRQMSVCHYVIKDNELYRETLGEYVGFKMFSDLILKSLLKKIRMPDLDFAWNFGDWPLSKGVKLPLVSWCGSDDSHDIVVPTYDVTTSTIEAMYRTDKDMLNMQYKRKPDWEKKQKKAFWRGRDSSVERLELVKQGVKQPDLIDAQLTHVFFFPDHNLTTHPVVPFTDFFNYTYQISMDGTVAGYRLPYLLAGGSLVFKQESHYYEHFYRNMRAYEHYIPLKRDISDLLSKLQWAKQHDEKAQSIAKNAYDFVNENLLPVDIFCYHAVLFKTYAERLTSRVDVDLNMEHVKKENHCDCSGHNNHEEL